MPNSNEFRIRYLLDRCMAKQETEQERRELNTYFKDEKNLAAIDRMLLEYFFQPKELTDMSLDKQEHILQSIYLTENTSLSPKKLRFGSYVAVAAVFLGIIGALIWIGKEKTLTKSTKIGINDLQVTNRTTKFTTYKKENKTTEKVALLEMSDGTKIDLSSIDSAGIFKKNGFSIQKTSEGTVLLRFIPNIQTKEFAFISRMNSIKTPRGGTYKVILSDGTTVDLNAESTLSFPTVFKNNERRVTIEGEAYFDVAKDKHKQFVVFSRTGNQRQEIRVFGTKFNVFAYPNESTIKTTLIAGNVRIKDLHSGKEIEMKPNELVEFRSGQLIKEKADLVATLAWKNNLFYFANQPIDNVFEQISRWYDIDIIWDENIPKEPIWGQISRDKKLSEVLEVLETTNHLKFEIKGKEVHVKKK